MAPRQIFFNPVGRLRSGWRLLIFAAVFILLMLVLTTLGRGLYVLAVRALPGKTPRPFFQDLIFRLMFLIGALSASFICTRWLEGLPWRAVGLSFHFRWFRDFLIGSIIGIASLALAAAIATAGGGLTFTIAGDLFVNTARTLASSAVLFVFAALAEEALFRGYPLQTMSRAKLIWLGVFLTSVPFAAVHLRNPNVVAGFTFINTALAGVWLAVAYWRTRSLWFPLGIHWAWNWALGSLFGLPVSGMSNLASHPLLRGFDLGPAWLTGGNYGIEGGLACTLTLLVSTVFIWRTRMVSATPEMYRLTSQENPAEVQTHSPTSEPPGTSIDSGSAQ
jgi:membrane protease YdiL (CAAX protease family)